MMEEMDDDFGDLYADVELQVSAAINEVSGFDQLHLEHDNKNENSSVDDRVAPESRLKKVNSISQESGMCSKDDTASKDGKLIENDTGTLDLEADGEEELFVDGGSDSEDDLHIVLNEDDCRKYPVPGDAVTGNRGMIEGSDDEEDDFVIVTDANCPSNDRNLLDQLQSSCDGLEQAALCSSAEKGTGMKGSHLSQYSQYKYIRPVNSKGSGSGVAVPLSPLPGKGDWDVNGSNQKIVSSMSHIASTSSTVLPFVAQRGYEFSLPRYRTILDVNIDTLEWKPWRHPGADITDFFNFDLDEESWKEYCNCLEQFRQQANLLSKAPESFRLNQAHRVEFEHATVASEAVSGESGQIGSATRVSLSFKSADKGGKRLEVPKGRAIQVEGGIGERQPSMDVRRSRNRDRDSDVVIQIAVHDSSGDSTGSSEQERHVDNAVLEISKSRDSGPDDNSDMHDSDGVDKDAQSIEPEDECSNRFDISHVKDYGARCWKRCSRPTATSNALTLDSDALVNEHIYDVNRHHHEKAKGHVFEDEKIMVTVEQTKEAVVNGMPSKADPLMLEAESSLGNQIQCCINSSYLDSHSKEPNDGMDTLKALERPSSNSAAELWESVASDNDNSKYSENDSDMELGECKYGSADQSPNHVKQNSCGRMQPHSVAELKDHRDDDTLMSARKERYGGNHSKVSHGTHKRWRRNDGFYDREDLSCHRVTEVSTGCRSDRPVDRQARNGCTENFHGIPQRFEEDMDPFPTRHWNEKDYLIDQRITAEYSKREDYLRERGHRKDRIKSISYKKYRSLSGHSSLYIEEARNPWQRRKRDEESRFRKRTPDDEYESEHRCSEELQEKYVRHVPYNDREPFKKTYDRHIPYIGREIERSGKINRYCRSPRSDLDTSWGSAGYDDEFWRHPDDRCIAVDTCREFEIVNERQWQDITSPRNDTSDLRRFDERYFDHWRRIKHRDSCWLDSMYENDYCAEDDSIYRDDNICKRRRRSEAFHWDENKLCSRHQDQYDMYAEEAPSSFNRNKKNERIHVEREPTHHGCVLNEQIGSKIVREEIRISQISNHGNSGINVICRVKHEQATLRSRDSALGGWEGKPSGRCSKAGDDRCNGGHSHMDGMVDNERMVFGHSDEAHTREAKLPYRSKVASRISSSKNEVRQCKWKPSTNDEKWLDMYPVTQYHEASDLEEGQLAEEPEKKEIGNIEQKHVSGNTTGTGDVKGGRVKIEGFGNEEKSFGVYDNRRILEALMKMEKRRERFKEPIPPKEPGKNPKPEPAPTVETADIKWREHFKELIPLKEPVKNPKSEPAPTVETADVKQQRPLRKRRWAGS